MYEKVHLQPHFALMVIRVVHLKYRRSWDVQREGEERGAANGRSTVRSDEPDSAAERGGTKRHTRIVKQTKRIILAHFRIVAMLGIEQNECQGQKSTSETARY